MKKSILCLVLLVFMSCSKLDSKCGNNIETINSDLKELHTNGEISNEEYSLLVGKIFSSDLNELAGKKTYNEILQKQKLLSLIKKNEREKQIKEVNETLEITLAKEKKITYQKNSVIYPLNLTNKSNKDVRGFLGTVVITDLLDNELGKFVLKYEETINKLNSEKIFYPQHIRKYKSEKILNKGIKKIKIKWIPYKVIFTESNQMSIGNNENIEILLKKKYIANEKWCFLLEFKNNSNKIINAFGGNIVITDLFGYLKRDFAFVIDNEIKPNSTTQKLFKTSFSGIEEDNYEFKSKNIENFRLQWEVNKIIF